VGNFNRGSWGGLPMFSYGAAWQVAYIWKSAVAWRTAIKHWQLLKHFQALVISGPVIQRTIYIWWLHTGEKTSTVICCIRHFLPIVPRLPVSERISGLTNFISGVLEWILWDAVKHFTCYFHNLDSELLIDGSIAVYKTKHYSFLLFIRSGSWCFQQYTTVWYMDVC